MIITEITGSISMRRKKERYEKMRPEDYDTWSMVENLIPCLLKNGAGENVKFAISEI